MTDPLLTEDAARREGLSLGSDLCTSCGLCCSGALHTAAVLDDDEIAGARALGLPVLDREKPGFALPCPRLDGAVCTIYLDRPRVCSRYKCQLLQDVEAGEIPLEQAMTKVGIGRTLFFRAVEALPRGMSLSEGRALVARDLSTPSARDEAATPPGLETAKLHVTALMIYLDKHFRNDREGKMLGSISIESSPGQS